MRILNNCSRRSKADMKRVLVVDDHPPTVTMLTDMLCTLGYDVEVAPDGYQCLDKLKTHEEKPFEAIFLDILMPGLSGIEVLNRIKGTESLSGLPVILLTSQDKPEHIIAGYQVGADYYMPKPFTIKQLGYALHLISDEACEENLEKRDGTDQKL